MKRVGLSLLVPLCVIVSGCVDNTSPGNDREAELDPPRRPAHFASAGEAIDGVATHLLMPEIMTDADLANVTHEGDGCLFRMTRVGLPVLVYGADAIVKMNGRLVSLEGRGNGRYVADGVEVSVRPLTAGTDEGQFPAQFVLRLPGAANELGFHGFSEC